MERSLPKTAYTSLDFYRREQEAIFWHQWVYACRLEALASPAGYTVLDVAGESIIIVRDVAGSLNAHLNLCRHRGSRLLCGEGELRGAIRCPYHGWSYNAQGRLIAAPFVSLDDVPPENRALHPVAIAQWGGFVFVNLNRREGEAERSLLEQLGRVPQRLQRYEFGDLRTARSITYGVRANWKVVLENYNECYHCAGVHPELCRIVPAFKRSGGAGLDWEHGIEHREGASTFSFSGTTVRAAFPNLNEHERARHNGELLYPNFMLSLSADHVTAFRLLPDGPEKTAIRCDFLFHPSEIAKPDFDPSDAVDFWDVVNRQDWHVCELVQSGMSSRMFEFGYYAPMEDASLDIRRYVAARLGEE